MNVSREDKKIEAIKRMELLKIFPQTIKDFKDEDLVSISEPPFGAYFWAKDEDLEHIRKFEEKYNALVYTVIRSYMEFGTLLSYFYVSDYEEEWEVDRKDLQNNEAVVYVRNDDYESDSEFGHIGFELAPAAGLIRIW